MYTWPSGEKYIGEFDNNKRHGQGTHIWPNGEKYVGEFVEGSKMEVELIPGLMVRNI